MMIGTWIASHGVPESTGGIGWMNRSMGRRSVSAIVSAAIAFAFRTTRRLRRSAERHHREEPDAPGEEEQRLVHVGRPGCGPRPSSASRCPRSSPRTRRGGPRTRGRRGASTCGSRRRGTRRARRGGRSRRRASRAPSCRGSRGRSPAATASPRGACPSRARRGRRRCRSAAARPSARLACPPRGWPGACPCSRKPCIADEPLLELLRLPRARPLRGWSDIAACRACCMMPSTRWLDTSCENDAYLVPLGRPTATASSGLPSSTSGVFAAAHRVEEPPRDGDDRILAVPGVLAGDVPDRLARERVERHAAAVVLHREPPDRIHLGPAVQRRRRLRGAGGGEQGEHHRRRGLPGAARRAGAAGVVSREQALELGALPRLHHARAEHDDHAEDEERVAREDEVLHRGPSRPRGSSPRDGSRSSADRGPAGSSTGTACSPCTRRDDSSRSRPGTSSPCRGR